MPSWWIALRIGPAIRCCPQVVPSNPCAPRQSRPSPGTPPDPRLRGHGSCPIGTRARRSRRQHLGRLPEGRVHLPLGLLRADLHGNGRRQRPGRLRGPRGRRCAGRCPTRTGRYRHTGRYDKGQGSAAHGARVAAGTPTTPSSQHFVPSVDSSSRSAAQLAGGSRIPTNSTCSVIGKRSKALSDLTVHPASRATLRSRANGAGSHDT